MATEQPAGSPQGAPGFDLDSYLSTPATLADPQGFSSTGAFDLDGFLYEPQSLDEFLIAEPADVPVTEDDDEGFFNENLLPPLANLSVKITKEALNPETMAGIGTSWAENWERTKLGFEALAEEERIAKGPSIFELGQPLAEGYEATYQAAKARVEEESSAALKKIYEETRESLRRQAEATPQNMSLWRQGIRGAAESLPSMAASLGSLAVTRNPLVAATVGAAPVLGESKASAGAAGVEGGAGTLKASLDAGLEAALGILPAKHLGKLIDGAVTGAGSQAKEVAKSVVSDLTSEQLTTLGQSLNAYAFGLDEQMEQAKDWQEMAAIQSQRQLVSAISSVLLTGGSAAGITALGGSRPQVVDTDALPIEPTPPTPAEFVGPLISTELLNARLNAQQAEKKFSAEVDRKIKQDAGIVDLFGTPAMSEPLSATPQIDYMNVWKDGQWKPAPQVLAEQEKPGVYTADMNDWLEAADKIRQQGTPEAITKATEIQSQVMQFADTMQRMKPMVEKWRKQFLPDTTIFLGALHPEAKAQGTARLASGVGKIQLAVQNFQNTFKESKAYALLGHEFGHLLANTEYQKLGPKAKKALEIDYQAWVQAKKADMLLQDFMRTRETPIEADLSTTNPNVTVGQVETDPRTKQWMEYYTSRTEWLAQQMARYQAYDKQALKIAKPFFSSLVAKLRAFHKKAKKEFAPSSTFESWLTSLSAQNRLAELEATELERTAAAWQEVENSSIEDLTPAQYEMAEAVEAKHRFTEWRKAYGDQVPKPTKVANSLGAKIKSPAFKELDEGQDIMSRFKKNWYTILQNAKNNPHIPGLVMSTPEGTPGFVKLFEQHMAFKRAEAKRMDGFLADWRNLGAQQSSRVGELAMIVDGLSRETGMRLLPSQIAAEAQKLGLSEESLKFYFRMQDEFSRKAAQLEEALISRAMRRDWAEEGGRDSYIASVKARVAQLQSQNYFPSSRFGQHVVMVKAKKAGEYKGKFYMPGETLLREHYETEGEAKERAESLRKQNIGQQHTVGLDKIVKYSDQSYQGMPPLLLQELLSRLPESEHQAVRDAMAAAAPGQGFAKHLLRKKGTAGASKNFRRSYLSYMESFNRHLARIQEEDLFDKAIKATADSAEALIRKGKDATTRRQVQEMMADTKNYLYDPGQEFRGWGSLAFNYYLSGVPKHAMLALWQIPQVAYPNLAAQYGDAPTVAAMSKSMKRIYGSKYAPEKLPQPLQEALQQAEVDGLFEETLARETAALAQAANLERLAPLRMFKGDTISHAWSQFSQVASAMFHYAEKFARQITFHSAWELEYSRSRDSVAAYNAAKDAVQRGHFSFTAANNPPIMRGKIRPLFVFQTHVQGMLEFLLGANNPGKWRGLATLALAAGATGLPFAEDLEELANWAIRKYNSLTGNYSTPPASKDIIRKELVDMMQWAGEDSSKVMADLVLDGSARWGFGLPWVEDMTGVPLGSFDLTPSLGLGRIIPGASSINVAGWDKKLATATEGIAGPAIGVPLGMMQAMVESEASGEWRLGKFLPAMIENPLKASGWSEGSIEDKYGRKVLDFDPNNPSHKADAIWMAMGMQPTRLTVERDARWAATRVNEYYATARTYLIKQMEEAVKSGEQEAIADVTAAIRKFNATVPHKGYALDPKTIAGGVKARMKRDKGFELGLPTRMRDVPATRELQESFPTPPGE